MAQARSAQAIYRKGGEQGSIIYSMDRETRLVRYLLCLFIKELSAKQSFKFSRLYIHLINQVRGPYWENIGTRSQQYTPSAARSVQKRLSVNILPVKFQARKVNKRFLTRLKKIIIDRRGHQKSLRMNGILTEHFKGVLVEK